MDCRTQLWNPSFTSMRWKTEKIMSTFTVTVHHDSQVLLLCLLVLRWWFTAGPWQCFCWLLRMNGSCHAILLPLGRNPRLFITISIQILSIYLTASSTVYIIKRVRQICTFVGIEIDICQVTPEKGRETMLKNFFRDWDCQNYVWSSRHFKNEVSLDRV